MPFTNRKITESGAACGNQVGEEILQFNNLKESDNLESLYSDGTMM
jgi:hypothetical protein